jgi:hypothetical protein
MPDDRSALRAAHALAAGSPAALARTVAFRQLPVKTQQAILRDLATLRAGFSQRAVQPGGGMAQALDRTPIMGGGGGMQPQQQPEQSTQPAEAPQPRRAATETLAARAGALSDEIDFPAFVAGLVHGTFDAMVDASIRQMEAYADLVSTVARSVDDFSQDNVSRGQVIDWLSEQYPKDLTRDVPLDGSGPPRLVPRPPDTDDEEARAPAWLADFGLEGEELTPELIDQSLIPAARKRLGENRMQTLATMVLLGMNRIVVKDGSISAKVRFRAAAKDKAQVAYATGQEPGRPGWGERGSIAYTPPQTMVSTVGVNVQAESDLKVELFGEVKINFASETLPLERFADSAQIALLQSHSNRSRGPAKPRAAAGTPAPDSGATTQRDAAPNAGASE